MQQKKAVTATNIRNEERSHVLGLLRIRLMLLKNESVTVEEIYSSLDSWINNRESQTNNKVN